MTRDSAIVDTLQSCTVERRRQGEDLLVDSLQGRREGRGEGEKGGVPWAIVRCS